MTKQHILEEIKRLALANGGKPPGRLTFYNATGIREQDWAGKFWPRWSEAILEAGFTPNSMIAGYDKVFLMEKFVGFARELGRFPVSTELRMKAYNDKGFPSKKSTKHILAQRISLLQLWKNSARNEVALKMCSRCAKQLLQKSNPTRLPMKPQDQTV